MSARRLLIVMHEDDCPPGWFGEWFLAAGLGYDAVPAHREPLPGELGEYDGLVVLGGQMGANDDASYPWLTHTKQLVGAAVHEEKPFLGICLGHQLAAVALGGEVYPNGHGRATGLTPVRLTSQGRGDALMSAVVEGARAVQWNHDVVTRLPDGATALATSPDQTVQAARFGRLAWGVQFHPETGPDIFRRWIRESSAPGQDADVDSMAAYRSVRDGEAELRRCWEPLARRFAGIVLTPELP